MGLLPILILCSAADPPLGLSPGRQLAKTDLSRAEAELSIEIGLRELKAHVHRLASPEFLGRRGPGAARAANHLAEAFRRLKLQPAFDGSYFQPIPWLLADEEARGNSFVGRNVAAVLPGADPVVSEEWIIVSAHLDHLGQKGDKLYPGADDNASGLAMLLEVAEHFALCPEKPRRTIMFVAFDLEESALQGSTHFAAHPPRDIRKLKVFLTADMIGRSMANVMTEYVFALGSERSPRLRQLLQEVAPPAGLQVGRLGADLIGTRSDYGPFRDRRVPFLFLTTGQHPDYHRPSDTPERVDYAKLRRISLWIRDLIGRLANDDEAPTWDEKGLPPDLDEVRTLLVLLARVLSRPQVYPLTVPQTEQVRAVHDRLSGIVQRGGITAGERTWLVWTARMLLLTVF
jgi:hypothetical protein